MTKEQALRASYIDSTILKAEAKSADIINLCAEARTYGFASVCINPLYVPLAHEALAGSIVKVCTVIGFPLGAMTSSAKAFEARDAVLHGADEVDMVISIGKVREHDREYVTKDIQGVVKAAKEANSKALVKVIIEACYLTDSEKVFACECAEKAGADFVKTSTGFGSGGANAHDVALMREVVGERLGVKAAGGIRTREDFNKMIKAGASRIGTSHGKELI